jgi:hypothetical protein
VIGSNGTGTENEADQNLILSVMFFLLYPENPQQAGYQYVTGRSQGHFQNGFK